MQRHNDGNIEALASPAFGYTYTDFSDEIEIDPVSTEIWIFGTGNVQYMLAGQDEYHEVFAAPNAGSGNIFITAKKIKKIGTSTTVPRIDVYN